MLGLLILDHLIVYDHLKQNEMRFRVELKVENS